MIIETQNSPQLYSVNALVDSEPKAFTRGGIRHLIFHRGEELESAGVVIRFGSKILIDKSKLIEWLRAGNGRKVA
ncbi:hypothetical protein HF670_07415 [Acidithiobacillus thiooxidans]|jgi:hypothetical protein|uniref:hypothetical protein n=1 Tax=Acidithiobacillus thiooxidans TaxID=930 RepID=UPI001C07DF0A|nr:hypothetical protein [Acidithiobacillus thiooxidans]MBU2839393.1 hypothetical protein [Acidithiobacillus thiooxidans]